MEGSSATTRLVVIDDNANDLQVTRRFLERKGYAVSTARSGDEGLTLIASSLPDAVVVDYRMPGMDGFEVTRRLKSDPQLQRLPVLMLTGADSAQYVVEGLGAGADDFVTKGSDLEVLLARLRALLRVKAYQDQLRKLNDQMSRDLQIARRVQEALVPHGSFRSPHCEILSAYFPSETLSGDFYDYFCTDGLTYLFVADVSGHGLPSAILVSLLKSYIHTEADARNSPAGIMSSLNDFLFTVSLPTQYATAQLFRIDDERNVVFSNAAHPPFLLYRKASRSTEVIDRPSHLVGAMPELPFEEETMRVEEGDILFLYTDGLTDRQDAAGEFYPIERVARVLDRCGDVGVDEVFRLILEDARGFNATDEFRDDIAFVVVRIT